MNDELAKRRERVARHLAAKRDEARRKIDIVGTMTDDECRAYLRVVLDDLSRLTHAVENAAPGTMTIGIGAIDAAIELLNATRPRSPVGP